MDKIFSLIKTRFSLQAAEAGKEAAAQAGKMLTKGIGGFAGKAFGSFFWSITLWIRQEDKWES